MVELCTYFLKCV